MFKLEQISSDKRYHLYDADLKLSGVKQRQCLMRALGCKDSVELYDKLIESGAKVKVYKKKGIWFSISYETINRKNLEIVMKANRLYQ